MTADARFPLNVPDIHRPYAAADDRYARNDYRQVGTSGLFLPPISLGLWYNFGDNRPFDGQRALLRHAFDHGITHFDLANNYGPPYGSAETNFGRMMREDFGPYRNELIISSKAGYDFWPGPYGNFGSKKYLTASLDESLERMGLDYVDVFYSHRVDEVTPIEETVGALDAIVRSGKALYVGISSYSAERTAAAHAVARELGTPLVIHQPSYSILNRWVEDGLTEVLTETGLGAIAFVPLAQGLLTDKYLGDGPAERATNRPSLPDRQVSEEMATRLRSLNDIAVERGQTLAQMSLAWVLNNPAITSALIGASRPEQLDENLAALDGPAFTTEELEEIDRLAEGADVNIWADSSDK
ncbi:L-glyceraldehyde 3-phosphate reductase [Plantibacter sp. VKM Ac-2885]|jgi:L-glyceraldehyde 3-phosphate reductase|uniref:L-glyceraldehyde 3-phosphate reductase n=1 Tax=Plantibacter TaxID=190323 RepID=UPI000F600F79|nr:MULTISPECIES: L-glyceraldehyde 3-phosphate reductase [Plantibacter]AZH83293.1 L-glyceraldehyde 3-phosphate reductase [Plantibacter sp. PA-3-X8]MBD8102319.1 L-glyceraldehyde 3-phosphate reductase [Plantibacter sp. CFBP 8775]MBD8466984.1 L-glyceraldehyde 3-phosphate reductase [Plantibacter sp. CFBP 8798]MBD8535111.1 L-glyceraldehyde 3-phosphate reductase [Plantibacter sp. CFBP 13570]MBF4512411.1 L-glyceraldehyde 3-phosphate reductase [Plantibacter sp. VKM Ac-2885]